MYNSNTNPIYAFVPGGYKADFIPPVIGNELDRFTFVRNTVGSRRKKDGLLEQMSIGVPRLNYDYKNNCPYLLLEDQSTNLLPNSQDFTQSNWTTTNLNVTLNEFAAPDGTNTAMKLEVGSTGERYASDNVTLVINEKAQISCFAKAGTSGFFALSCVDAFGPTTDEAIGTFDLVRGVVGVTNLSSGVTPVLKIEPYNNGWYRCIMEFVASSNGAWNARIVASAQAVDDLTAPSGDFVYAWGAQAEVSEECTAYIKTSATTLTRTQENAAFGLTSTPIRSPLGALYFEFENTAAPISGTRGISISDGTKDDCVQIFQTGPSPGGMSVEVTVKGVLQAAVNLTTNVLERNKIAVVWGVKNDVRVYLNGRLNTIVEPTNTFLPGVLNRLNLSGPTNADNYYGHVHDVRVYDVMKFNMSSDEINRFFTTLTN